MEWKKLGPAGIEGFDAAAARQAFRDGRAAMLIDRAEQVGTWSGGKPVGVAALPGSERVYDPMRKDWAEAASLNRPSYLAKGGGWLIGISKNIDGTQREAALDFAMYLAGPDNLNRLRASGVSRCCRFARASLARGCRTRPPRQTSIRDSGPWPSAIP